MVFLVRHYDSGIDTTIIKEYSLIKIYFFLEIGYNSTMPKQRLIEIGTKFGKWTTLSECTRVEKVNLCKCICKCGIIKEVRVSNLISGKTTCCGCTSKGNRTHFLCTTRIYRCWTGMKQRILNPKRETTKIYKNIKICDEWLNFENFYKWAIPNGYEDAKTIDRINNNGDYEPSNCRWADAATQQNNKSSNHLLTAFGETKTISQWAKDDRCAVTYFTLCSRMRIGWKEEDAITKARYSFKQAK